MGSLLRRLQCPSHGQGEIASVGSALTARPRLGTPLQCPGGVCGEGWWAPSTMCQSPRLRGLARAREKWVALCFLNWVPRSPGAPAPAGPGRLWASVSGGLGSHCGARAGLTLCSLGFSFRCCSGARLAFCLAALPVSRPPCCGLPPRRPSLPASPCFGTASFGMPGLCFWQELAVAVHPMDGALSRQLVGQWSQGTCGTPETGQCGEAQPLPVCTAWQDWAVLPGQQGLGRGPAVCTAASVPLGWLAGSMCAVAGAGTGMLPGLPRQCPRAGESHL